MMKIQEQTRTSKLIQQVLFYGLLVIIFIFTMFPFYWALNGSFKKQEELFRPATYLPAEPTLQNYESVLTNDQFMRALGNSAFVSSLTVVMSLIVGSFAAYALGRIPFKGRTLMLYIVLSMTMFPQISILSGLFTIIRDLGLYGTPFALIASYPIFTLPFTVWVLTSFFQGLPGEIEEAAYVDGTTSFQTFYMIMLPLTRPALVTTGLLAFISAWNEYLYALTFTLSKPDAQTVPVAIAQFSGRIAHEEPIVEVMAAAMIVTIPLLALVLIFQNQIMAGLTSGAVKG